MYCFDLFRITKFHNSSWDERLKKLQQAEEELKEELKQPDSNRLCRLLNRCAAWLRPARMLGGEEPEASVVEMKCWLQGRIRKILISILRQLDLEDPQILQQVEAWVMGFGFHKL